MKLYTVADVRNMIPFLISERAIRAEARSLGPAYYKIHRRQMAFTQAQIDMLIQDGFQDIQTCSRSKRTRNLASIKSPGLLKDDVLDKARKLVTQTLPTGSDGK